MMLDLEIGGRLTGVVVLGILAWLLREWWIASFGGRR